MLLFFDTETTDKYDFNQPPDAHGQPWVCQLGAIMTDDAGKIKAEVNILLKDRQPTAETTQIHGIKAEDCTRWGVPSQLALRIFASLVTRSNKIIGHNIDFDVKMLIREILSPEANFSAEQQKDLMFRLKNNAFCTMKSMTDVCKLPPRGGRPGYKWPSLQEAYKFCFGQEFENAHDAMADVRACRDIYFKQFGSVS